jgi:hypothetical protein
MVKKICVILVFIFVSCENSENDTLKKVFEFPKNLDEVSGIALGSDKFIYTIQDSGNKNEIVVVDSLGTISRKIKLPSLENNDWEDLTFDKNENLYIGDFGNNNNDRKDLAIYKINKNDLNEENVDNTSKISFDYPEQKEFPPNKKNLFFDVEAFFEYKNNFYLFTKNRSKNFDGTSYVYKIPNIVGHHHAQLIKTIKTCKDQKTCAITSAAISPNGKQFVLLTHTKIWLFENYNNDDINNAKMTELQLNHNSQKEAVCFKNQNTLFIADERVKNKNGNLYEIDLKNLKK